MGLRSATESPSALRFEIASVAQPEGRTEAVRAGRRFSLHLRQDVMVVYSAWPTSGAAVSKLGAWPEESLVVLSAEEGEGFCRKRLHQVRGRDAEDTSGKNKARIVKTCKDEQVLWVSFQSVQVETEHLG